MPTPGEPTKGGKDKEEEKRPTDRTNEEYVSLKHERQSGTPEWGEGRERGQIQMVSSPRTRAMAVSQAQEGQAPENVAIQLSGKNRTTLLRIQDTKWSDCTHVIRATLAVRTMSCSPADTQALVLNAGS